MSDLSIDIDKPHIPVETTNKDNNSKPHNGNPITKIEISPSGNYIVTYSEEDNSIVGWNVENIDEGQLKPDNIYDIEDIKDIENIEEDNEKDGVKQICVSDDKKLVYIDDGYLKIIDMNNNNQEINLYFDEDIFPHYCTFNLNSEFILYSTMRYKHTGIVWIYSTKTTKNKWNCKKIYELSDGFDLIGISKYDSNKLYLLSYLNSFYEWDILTGKSIRIFGNDEIKKYIEYNEFNMNISKNGKFACLKINDKIVIYSIELEIPIVSLDINNNDIQNFMNDLDSGLYSLLDISSEIMEYCWKECLGRLKQSPKEYQTENLPILFDNTSKFVFRILDGHVWKIKLKEKINFSFENSDELNNKNDEIIESWNIYLDNECHLNIHLFNPYMDTIHNLFQEIISNNSNKCEKELELTQDLIKIKVNIVKFNDKKIQLLVQVFKKNNVNSEWDLICKKNDNYNFDKKTYRIGGTGGVYGIELCNENNIVILTSIGLSIYHFNESISLNYFYYMDLNKGYIKYYYEKVFSKSTLPSPNYDSFKCRNGLVSYVKDNKLRLLKYGVELLSFAIKEHKLKLIEDIYEKCINYFKQDLENNRMFLSIITSTMPILNEYYPEYYPAYILRYSLETTMIVDSPFYSIHHKNGEHLYSFSQYPQIVDLSRSILWTKFAYLLDTLYYSNRIMFWILKRIQILIVLLTFPIYFSIFYILSKSHFINNIYGNFFSRAYFKIFDKISSKQTTTIAITFMIPYIKFVNYPQHYSWFWELIRPQSSPFVKTISRDIYKTWSGEALINFKWNTYGKYYYAIIWIMFIALFGCFITAANIPFAENVRNKLLIASIILGFIHLITEIRQIIYDFNKWIRDLWNIFDIVAYLLPIYTSVYWLQKSDINDQIIRLLSFSCLFLYIKFVMFFRAFDAFGVYFAIIFNVGKKIFSFLVVLLIIIMGFANAFYILLLPRSDIDPNSPLSLATTYNRVLDNGTIDSNPFMIQPPDDNTNMFVDYRTSILAMYLFLTGDSSSLTNWSYKKDPSLVILIFFFSFLVVVYFMNLFIGLLNLAIDIDNDRVSYLMQKAEILAEIELFYLLPNQRRWKAWFLYYYASVDKTREKVKEMIDNGEWKANDFSQLKRDLLNKLNIQHNPDN